LAAAAAATPLFMDAKTATTAAAGAVAIRAAAAAAQIAMGPAGAAGLTTPEPIKTTALDFSLGTDRLLFLGNSINTQAATTTKHSCIRG
jgi:hypothetical protein